MHTLAIHLIWTCYMTWPPGDPRGHWSPLFDLYGHLKQNGRRLNRPDSVTLRRAETLAKEPKKVLTSLEIEIVSREIGKMIDDGSDRDGRVPGMKCYAAAIEPTHVHLLLSPLSESLGKTVGRIKGRTSSAVLELPMNAERKRTWTGGYWKVFLGDEEGVYAVKDYIEQHNIRSGLPAKPFDWIERV